MGTKDRKRVTSMPSRSPPPRLVLDAALGKLDFFVAVEMEEFRDGAGVMALGPQGDGGRQGKHDAQGREDAYLVRCGGSDTTSGVFLAGTAHWFFAPTNDSAVAFSSRAEANGHRLDGMAGGVVHGDAHGSTKAPYPADQAVSGDEADAAPEHLR